MPAGSLNTIGTVNAANLARRGGVAVNGAITGVANDRIAAGGTIPSDMERGSAACPAAFVAAPVELATHAADAPGRPRFQDG